MAIKINKKIIFSLIIIILLLIAGGVFCWQNREIKGSPEDYVVKETPEGKIVENKKAGLTVKVPEGWIEEKIEIEESSMIFYSPDAEGYRPNKKTPPLKTGCVIEIGIMYKKINFEEIKTRSKISLDELIDRVIKDVGIERNELTSSRRGQKVSYARAVISYLAVNQLGRSASDVARKLAISGMGVGKCVQRGNKILDKPGIMKEYLA